jgi:hypothetical protein
MDIHLTLPQVVRYCTSQRNQTLLFLLLQCYCITIRIYGYNAAGTAGRRGIYKKTIL